MKTALFFVLLFATSVFSTEEVQKRFDKLRVDYRSVQTIKADFKQTIRKRRFGEEHFQGNLVAKKPNKLKCDYDQPKGKTIVSDGKQLTLYDPEDQQALISDMTAELPPPFSFLWGDKKWENEFDISMSKKEKSNDPKISVFELTPKKEFAGVSNVLLWIRNDGERSTVYKSRVSFVYGEENELEFFHSKLNVPISDDKFVIHLPKNVAKVQTPTVK